MGLAGWLYSNDQCKDEWQSILENSNGTQNGEENINSAYMRPWQNI